MRRFLLAAACIATMLVSPFSGFRAEAQDPTAKKIPTDNELMALVNKYVQTPVKKTVNANGEVFLQRDLTSYLSANVMKAPPVGASEQDHGHDHKDEMLRTFLNRPQPSVATMEKYFTEAANEFLVPVSILKATAQVQSNWAQVSESIYGSWGVMGLIENRFSQQISKAASLLGVSTDSIKNDAKTNIRAAAALLAHYNMDRSQSAMVEDWFESVKDLTGLWDKSLANDLTMRIYDVMESGSKTVSLWGEIISIEPANVILSKSITEREVITTQRTTAVDYPLAVANFTTCNFNSRPAGSVIKYYFVHYVATGTYQGAINWFKDCSSNVSAHYVIRNSDGEVSQVVAEASRAWSQGVTHYNDAGIGVEHEVLATNLSMWDSNPMLTSAANLCKNVCNRQGIPTVRRVNNGDPGIYGHSDVRATDCPNMTPARWTNFLNMVNSVSVAAPTLYSISNPGTGTQVSATWKANIEPTLVGYRLYYAKNDALTDWALAANETTLTATTTSVTLNTSQFIVPPTGDVYHFKLTAVATDGANPLVEGPGSDVYSRSSSTTGPKVLIVDGFDRFGGGASYPNATHSFAASYFKSLRNNASLQINTVADEKVADNTFPLTGYDMVVWFSGDESSSPVVLSANEKNRIRTYLDNGGKLLISGSEIAYNFGRSNSSIRDSAFINNYLKANYINDGSSSYTPASGVTATAFQGLRIPFGFVYHEDFPDAIAPVTGATTILSYNVSPNNAGVAYKGTFGSGTIPGGVIFISFPLETTVDSNMVAFMGKALTYFDVPVTNTPMAYDDVATASSHMAKHINVLANDFTNGILFNPTSVTVVTQPANGTVRVESTGAITYTSNPGFIGTDRYQYSVQNANGQLSNTATVTLSVVAATECDPTAPEVNELVPKRDLRGAWISTVFNLDWPSSRSLTTTQQQTELKTVLDGLAATGINTVFFQVRPEGDALYQSSIEPWSYWLTGTQGTAPSPLWDPLTFAIEEAHKRGMELHAWVNPYRAKSSTPTLHPSHVAVEHPDWTFVAGSTTVLNPGLPDVRTYLTEVIADIASRYDVDGIHFDDYFYPSGMRTQDAATFSAHNPAGLTLANWRRDNVNKLIARVYDTISVINAAKNSNIVFGVSPIGIWKNGTPVGITGNPSFDSLYCDPIGWMQAGKVDYISPQLYWIVGGPQDYNTLSKWWNDQGRANNRYVYPGLALYRLADASNWSLSEIENQIIINRDQLHEQVKGQILFRAKQIMDNAKNIRTSLQNNLFRYKALPPAMLWKDAVCPNAPVNVRRDGDTLRWDEPIAAADGDVARKYVVYRFANSTEAMTHINDGTKVYAISYATKAALPVSAGGYFMVTSVDDNNNESEAGAAIILPVTGLDLTVRLTGNTTLINWQTRTEINTQHFEIERSTDGNRFKTVGTVTAAGNSNVEKQYAAQDFLTTIGTYYYRIKTVDKDGRSSYSAVKTVVYSKTGSGILVGPNPFVNNINISNLDGVKRLELIDLAGRVILTRVVNNQSNTTLSTSKLQSGVYHLRVTKTNNEYEIIKLVKM